MYGQSDVYDSPHSPKGFGTPGVDCPLPSTYGACGYGSLSDVYGATDEEYGGLFPKYRTKRKIRKLEKLYGRIIGLVETEKVEKARKLSKRMVKVWDRTQKIHNKNFDAGDYIEENAPNLDARMEAIEAFADGDISDPRDFGKLSSDEEDSIDAGQVMPGSGLIGTRVIIKAGPRPLYWRGGAWPPPRAFWRGPRPGWWPRGVKFAPAPPRRRRGARPLHPAAKRAIQARTGPGKRPGARSVHGARGRSGGQGRSGGRGRPGGQGGQGRREKMRGLYGGLAIDASQFIFPYGEDMPENAILRGDLLMDKDGDILEMIEEIDSFEGLAIDASQFRGPVGDILVRGDMLMDDDDILDVVDEAMIEVFGGYPSANLLGRREENFYFEPYGPDDLYDDDLYDSDLPGSPSSTTSYSPDVDGYIDSEDPEDDDAYTPAKGRGRRKSGHGKDAEFVRYKDRAPRTPLKFLRKDTQRRIVNLQQRHKRLIGRGDIVKAAKTLAEIGVLQDVQHRAVAQAERAMSSGSYVHSKAPSYRTPWQKA